MSVVDETAVDNDTLKTLLAAGDFAFWPALAQRTAAAQTFEDLLVLATLRRRAVARGLALPTSGNPLRLALVGGNTFYPLQELIAHNLAILGVETELWTGGFDNYVSLLWFL